MNAEQEITGESLRTGLKSLDGVHRAFVEGPPWRISLVCDHSVTNPTALEVDARALLTRAGLAASDAELQLSFLTPPARQERVRFLHSRVMEESPTRAIASVALEWSDTVVEEHEEGNASPVSVLRLCANATIHALQALIHDALHFHLIGIKTIRVFDGDLVVALIGSEEAPHQQLIGATLAHGDPHRAAALAVLNATNRVLGNYLNVGPSET